jgi:hypothetical protein
MASIVMHRKPVLRGWKLYVAVGVTSYALLVLLMWLQSLKRHHNAPFEIIPEIAFFAAIATVCILASLAWTERRRR